MLQNEYIKSLMNLGLTLVQARAYLALCRLDNATIKNISKVSNLARQDVYRIMPTLQKMGLVEQVIATPIKYKAVPLDDGLKNLLQHKDQEQAILKKETARLLDNLHEENPKASIEETSQLLVISEISLLFKKLMEGTRASKISIESVGSWEAFEGVVSVGFEEFQNALDRGVRIRSITEKPTSKKLQKYIKNLEKHPLYQIRFIDPPAPVTLGIVDRKELNLSISKSDKNISSLWSNNEVIINLASNYFEDLWKNSSKKKKIRPF